MNTSAPNTLPTKRGYIPQINPKTATVEEIDDWIIALGGREVSPEEMREIVRGVVDWGDVPGENPGDPGFPFAKYFQEKKEAR